MSLESMEVVYQLATYSHDLNHHNTNQLQYHPGHSSNDEDENEIQLGMSVEKKQKGMTRRSASLSSSKKHSSGRSRKNESSFLLNAEYIHMFVSNCISSCENTQDWNRQYKFVRLLSVFLQTLIQKNIVQVEVSCRGYTYIYIHIFIFTYTCIYTYIYTCTYT
jgi:hypothetical protein